MSRHNKLLDMPITSINKTGEVEKFLDLDRKLGIIPSDELQECEELYKEIYNSIKDNLNDLSKLEEVIAQIRCQKMIKSEIKIYVSQIYIYARATFYREEMEIKDLRVLMGPISELGNDVDELSNNPIFMESARNKLHSAMEYIIQKSYESIKKNMVDVCQTDK